jgi:hypothetical protein
MLAEIKVDRKADREELKEMKPPKKGLRPIQNPCEKAFKLARGK